MCSYNRGVYCLNVIPASKTVHYALIIPAVSNERCAQCGFSRITLDSPLKETVQQFLKSKVHTVINYHSGAW